MLVLWAVFAAVMFGLLPSPATLEWKSFPYNLMYMLFGVLWFNTSRQSGQETGGGVRRFGGSLLRQKPSKNAPSGAFFFCSSLFTPDPHRATQCLTR